MNTKPRIVMFAGWWCCGIAGPNFTATHARTALRAYELFYFHKQHAPEYVI